MINFAKAKQLANFLFESTAVSVETVNLTVMLDTQLAEYDLLSKEIARQTELFNKMIEGSLKRQNDLKTSIITTMKQCELSTHKTNDLVARLKRGGTRQNVSYKPLWETALKKVNQATKDVLLKLQTEYTSVSDVADSFGVKNESIMSDIWSKLKSFFSKVAETIKKSVSGLDKANSELEKILKDSGVH